MGRLFHAKIIIMKNNLKLAALIGVPVAVTMILLLLIEQNTQFVYNVWFCVIIGTVAIVYMYEDEEIRNSLQKEGKLPRKVIMKVTIALIASVVITIGWHFIKKAIRQ